MNRVLEAGLAAGCPIDQMINFRQMAYIPQPKQLLYHAAARRADLSGMPSQIGFGGARGPGKSHAAYAQNVDDCLREPNLKVLMLRKVGKALKESTNDLRGKLLRYIPHKYSKSTGTTTFQNGSRIILGHFQNESDIDNYIGLEYDSLCIEECTTLSSEKYKRILTCRRTSKPNWRPRAYSNANPGGIGHTWYRELFVKNNDDDVAFFPATFRDNLFLDKGYLKVLQGLTGWLREAWLNGDWDIHAGAYFSGITPKSHMTEPMNVKTQGYQFYLAADYGFQHPTVVILIAVGGMNAYVLDYYSEAKRLTKQHSKGIDKMLSNWKLERRHIHSFVIGADAWQKGKDGTCVADEYESLGWSLEPAIMARVQGAQEILRRLGDRDAGVDPHLFFYPRCNAIVEQLQQMQHDPKRPEDVLKVDVDSDGVGGDDLYDALRYGLQSVGTDLGKINYDTLQFRR